jgi:hypothetical protein
MQEADEIHPGTGDWALVVNSLQNYLRARSLAVPPSAQLERRAHRDFAGGAKQQRVTVRRALLADLAVSNARFNSSCRARNALSLASTSANSRRRFVAF